MTSFFQSKTFRHFIPFMLVIIGGSFGLKEFTQLRYEYRRTKSYSIDESLEKMGTKKRGQVTLESEYEKLKEMDLDNWENVRVPRPWEENPNETAKEKKK